MSEIEIKKVKDGILSEAVWNSVTPKILFLLKEATKRSRWIDIAGHPIDVSRGDNRRFWPNVVR